MSADYRQTFKHVDRLRLEIGLPHPTAPNLVRFSPYLGAWGWITAVAGSTIDAYNDGATPPGWTGGAWTEGYKLTTASMTGGTTYEFYTETMPMTAGQWSAGRLAVNLAAGSQAAGVAVKLEFINHDAITGWDPQGPIVGSTAYSATFTGASGTVTSPTAQAPTGTTGVRLKVRVDRATTGIRTLFFFTPMVVSAASSAAATTAIGTYRAYVDSWVDVLGPTHSIEVDRPGGLDVGTLSARILDATLDPAVSTLIRPGRPCRLMVANGFSWEALYTGTVLDATVKYDNERATRGDNKHAQISLAAVDTVTTLGTARMPYGVRNISDLRSILESSGVAWNVNWNRNQLSSVVTAVSINENATVLDQVVTTRDTNAGFAWIDRKGALNVFDQATLDGFIVFGLTNLITNPSFEANTTGWTGVNGTLLRVATPTIGAPHGTSVLRYTSTNGGGGSGSNYLYSPGAAVTPGTTYTASFSLRKGATNADHRIMLRYYDGSGIPIAPDALVIYPAAELSSDTFTRMFATKTAPAGAVTARIFAFSSQALAVGQIFEVDAFLLTEGSEPVAFFEGTVQQSFSQRQYSDLDLAFSTKWLINEVNIKSIEWDPALPPSTASIVVEYGPYRDQASVQEWGSQGNTFTVHGLTPTEIYNLATSILARNKTPTIRANRVTVPVLTDAHIGQRAMLDLYNLLAVGYEPKRFSSVERIVGMKHRITERGWLIDYELTTADSVSIPQVTPNPK